MLFHFLLQFFVYDVRFMKHLSASVVEIVRLFLQIPALDNSSIINHFYDAFSHSL